MAVEGRKIPFLKEGQTFLQSLMACQDFLENPQTRKKVRQLVDDYYKKFAQLAKGEKPTYLDATIRALGDLQLSDEQRNRILGAILAADILIILEHRPDTTPADWFAKEDYSLSEYLIFQFISPDEVASIISIIKVAFGDPEVVEKYKKIGGVLADDSEEKKSWLEFLNGIFEIGDETEDESREKDNLLDIVDQVVEHIHTVEKKPEESPLSANFWLNACGPQNLDDPGQGVLWGSLIFLLGLALILSAPVTGIPSFGLSVGIGSAMMLVGGVAVMTGLGFFGGAEKDPDSPSTAEKPVRWFW